MKILKAVVVALFLAGVLARPASAELVTSLPDGTVVPMPLLNYRGPGPETFGPGITWSSTDATTQGGAAFGYDIASFFGFNGEWVTAFGIWAAVGDQSDSMTFAFSTPVSAVGGFLNYSPITGSPPTTIAVYDSSFNLIETANLTFSTGGGIDTGQFLGFQENSADISYFTLSNNYVGLIDLTISPQATVPEPTSFVLLVTVAVSFGGFAFGKHVVPDHGKRRA